MKSIPPPDPNTKIPTFLMPKLACDTHCHVFGPNETFPYMANRRYTPPDAPKEKLKELHKILGIERAVIIQASCHGVDNSAMIDAIASNRDSYRGVCNADISFTKKDFNFLHEKGICGIRFNFVKHLGGAPNIEEVKQIIDRVSSLPWHVELHFDAADIIKYEKLLDEIPAPVVIDHMGRVSANEGIVQEPFQLLLAKLKSNNNLWVKISGCERISFEGPPYFDAIPFGEACAIAAPNRCLWGTDWPHPNVGIIPNDGDLVDILPSMINDITLQQKILVDNPARLYNFGF